MAAKPRKGRRRYNEHEYMADDMVETPWEASEHLS
jgi:hypothetical protein